MNNASATPPWEELYRYWLDRHIDGKPPTRAEIDPMIDLRHLAPNLIIIDAHPAGSQYRLVGSKVVNHFGVDHTGKRVGTSEIDRKQLVAWSRAVDLVARDRKPHMLVAHYPGAEKSKTIALLVPLSTDQDGITKLLGGTFFDGPYPNTAAYPDMIVEKVEIDLL
jgi:hypothetical protein